LYIYDLPDWPGFRWNREGLSDSLASVRHQQGKLIGHMEALGFALREEAVLNTLTEDVVKTSAIEGEILNAEKVRSSINGGLGSRGAQTFQRRQNKMRRFHGETPHPYYCKSTCLRTTTRACGVSPE
jgi:Fic family protein